MSALTWDVAGERYYETGISKGVLYKKSATGTYPAGVAWSGLSAVTESPSGAEPTPMYADNIKYLNILSAEDFGATVEAYTYPDEFAECDGSAELATGVVLGQQTRKPFGLCYRTILGNDALGNDYGYKIHIIYDALAQPTEKGYNTLTDSPDVSPLSWTLTTTPVAVTGHKPTAILTIDSTKVSAAALTALEAALYGAAATESRLPLPDEIATIISSAA